MTPLVYEPPLTPGRKDAQRLLDAELRNPEYQQSEGLIERIMRWITEWFESFSASDGQTRWFLIIIVALLALLIGYAIFRITQRRRISHTHSSQLVGLLVDTSAEEYARLAQEAAAHGRWHDAVLARFRQLVKTAEDNVIIHPDTSDRPRSSTGNRRATAQHHRRAHARGRHLRHDRLRRYHPSPQPLRRRHTVAQCLHTGRRRTP